MSSLLIEKLRERAINTPDKIAIKDESGVITYTELWNRANIIASKFLRYRHKPIAVLCDRSMKSLITFWAIILSDNFYVPLNGKEIPQERYDTIISECEAVAVIKVESKLHINIESDAGIEVYDYENIGKVGSKKADEINTDIIIDTDPLYLVYTSGSTGTPKGVIKDHKSMISFIRSFAKEFAFGSDDVFGNQANFDYDVAAKDIFLSVFTGATLFIIPRKYFMVPASLVSLLKEKKITTLIWTVAAMRHLASSGVLENSNLDGINRIFFSGEELEMNSVRRWQRAAKNAELVNLYAPSEVTGNCLFYRIRKDDTHDRLPLGVPFGNIDVFALNEDMKPIKEGESGELYVRGSFLARGYYNNIAETEKRFIQNPLCAAYPDTVYRTGDTVALKNGELYFAGRIDNQIKFMGHRIELEEIESTIKNLFDGPVGCCVIFDKKRNILVAVMTREVDDGDMYKRLSQILPKYMIPSKYYFVEVLPENNRGKIDRALVNKLYMGKVKEKNE